MIDTHAHIDAEAFDADRAEMLLRSWENGVTAIVIPSIDPSGFEKLQDLVESDDRLYRAIGIHPHNVANLPLEALHRVERESSLCRVVAIGETGLDYYYDFAPREVQQTFFREQLRIAKRVAKPAIIHNREADEDILRILREEQDGSLQGVLHCYSSGFEVLHEALKLGLHVSFTGNITFKKSTLADVVRQVDNDKFMIETDSPYIAPVPFRGKRNEPMYVSKVAEKIAEIKNQDVNEVIRRSDTTAKSLFRLLILLLIAYTPLFAQDSTYHPFQKSIGVGFVLATNTIVDIQVEGSDQKRYRTSYEGLFSYGAYADYFVSDHLSINLSYIYSKNNKVLRSAENGNGQQFPNTHHSIELALRATPNPYSRVCFYGVIGPCLFTNYLDGGDDSYDTLMKARGRTTSVLGLGGGIGLFANIKTPIGLFSPGGEWRVDFFLKDEAGTMNTAKPGELAMVEATRSTFFSLPRFYLLWYPSF